jgi:hypothetical protein
MLAFENEGARFASLFSPAFVSNMRKAAYISQSNDKDDPGDAYKLAELLCWKPWLLHPIQYRSDQTKQI